MTLPTKQLPKHSIWHFCYRYAKLGELWALVCPEKKLIMELVIFDGSLVIYKENKESFFHGGKNVGGKM